ncbi:MAG: TRAP transporter substrate-binding protein [Saccharospirillum sp.]
MSWSHATELVFATSYDDGTHQTINHRVFASELQRESLNAMTVEVHSNASLYGGMDLFNAVSSGDIEIGEMILSSLASLDPVFLVDNLPFVVSDLSDSRVLWQQSRPMIEQALAEYNLKVLYTTPWPPQGIYTNRIPEDVSQLSGLRIRSYSDMTADLIRALGSEPVSVPANELEPAFEGGEIDAMITSVTTGVSSSSWRFVSTYSDFILWIPKNIVFMNLDSYNALSQEQRALVDAAADKAEARGWRLAREEYLRSKIFLSDNGLRIKRPNAALLDQMSAIGRTVRENWLADKEDSLRQLVEQLARPLDQ